ncbi:hypothetical protein [Chitinivorax sp. B]|uniref:hypothetical protein n=1 Tax=Chitinivorax sp. B TaxID=2502235 RepID=UPI0010F7F28C|nr:hypothetical protein [Chitinivorax sp. B]
MAVAGVAGCSHTSTPNDYYDDDKEYITGSNIPRKANQIRSPDLKVLDQKGAADMREALDQSHERIM